MELKEQTLLLLQAFCRTRFRKWTTEIGSWQ